MVNQRDWLGHALEEYIQPCLASSRQARKRKVVRGVRSRGKEQRKLSRS